MQSCEQSSFNPTASSSGLTLSSYPTASPVLSKLYTLLYFHRYWNGSGSLQTDTKFQTTAIKLITKYLGDNADANNNVHSEISKRDSEIEDLRRQLSHKEAENERFKKRLHNEEEIQRTIEMADQDLVSCN